MACSLSTGFSVSGPCFNATAKESRRHCPSIGTLQLKDLASREFLGKPLDYASDHIGTNHWNVERLSVCKSLIHLLLCLYLVFSCFHSCFKFFEIKSFISIYSNDFRHKYQSLLRDGGRRPLNPTW